MRRTVDLHAIGDLGEGDVDLGDGPALVDDRKRPGMGRQAGLTQEATREPLGL
jgi:hypothetical protein